VKLRGLRPRRWRELRLRTRVVAIVLALVTVAFALVAVVTAVQLDGFLVQRLDQQLRAAGDRYALSLEHSDADVDDGRQFDVAGQATGTLGARVKGGVVTAAGVVGHDDGAAQPGAAARAVLGQLHPAHAARSRRLPGLGPYRLLAQRGDDGDVLITGLPLHPVEETIHRLIAIEAFVFGGTLLAVGAGVLVFVRLSLRPLTRVADTAARVAERPLSTGSVQLTDRAPAAPAGTEVGQLATAFNAMLAHVEASLHRRQESEERLRRFIADASHELRTPVAVVRSHAELARRQDEPLPPEVAHALVRIGAESERMGRLVDDLLLLARLDSGRPLAHEEVDLTRIVLEAAGDARVAGPDHRWQLELAEEPVLVGGDPHALHQVVANLLANARTHTPAGTTVRTGVHLVGPTAELVVADDGPGIPAATRERLFERFVRGHDGRVAGTSSSGLGLAIVAAIVHAHGGEVDVTSHPGATEFRVRLPVDGAQPPSSP
jgi:two-component system OmpR family sensor kinase